MKWRRLALGWSQSKLGSESSVAQSDISRFETLHAIPYHGQAERLSEILGLDPEELQEPASTPEVVPAGGVE